jgi:hypothetical protein
VVALVQSLRRGPGDASAALAAGVRRGGAGGGGRRGRTGGAGLEEERAHGQEGGLGPEDVARWPVAEGRRAQGLGRLLMLLLLLVAEVVGPRETCSRRRCVYRAEEARVLARADRVTRQSKAIAPLDHRYLVQL